ncbi:MAG: HD domain-containing protein [Phycisphaerae bacterium]|nr:HD domain-containing protein [Phycisphaerae bacterium]
MPLLVQCHELQPGMRLAADLVVHGRVMLAGGSVLTYSDVDLLRQKHATLTLQVADPIVDQVVEFEDESYEREVAHTTQTKITQAMSEVSERFSRQASLTTVNFKTMHTSVTEVMEYLNAKPMSIALLSRSLDSDSYLSEHAGNVFYLSMILGAAVREYIATERLRHTSANSLDSGFNLNITPLGVGAMFCDIGMLPLQHLFKTDEPLTKQDWQAIRDHPISGAEALPDSFSPTTKMVVRTHHENLDGSGYPIGLSGDDLHIFTRIVRIADAFDAATAKHVYKEAKSPARVLWEMTVGPYRRFYDPVLMKVFCKLIQPFPIGAKLRLVDGRYAVVVRYSRQNPFLPTVIIAFDEQNRRIPKAQLMSPISLEQRRDYRIASFAGEDMAFIYGSRLIEDFAPARQEIETIFQAVFP